MFFLPKVSPQRIAAATVLAVQRNRATVRIPARYNGFHYLSNAPRQLARVAMIGVRLPRQ